MMNVNIIYINNYHQIPNFYYHNSILKTKYTYK